MKGNIIKYGAVIALVITSGGVLMNISQHVQRAEREIKSYDSKIAHQEETIRVLKAEWAYLNNPARLEALASQGLGFASPKAMDIISNLSRSSTLTPPPLDNKRSTLHRDISYVPSVRVSSPPVFINISSENKDGGAGQ